MDDNWLPMPRYKLRKDLVKRVLSKEALSGKTCLELGYGAGDMLLLYASLGLEAFGWDISELAFQNAGSRILKYPALKDRIHLLRDREEMKVGRYDYLLAFEVLEHIQDDLSCLLGWFELLKDNGKLLISVPAHRNSWGNSDVAAGHYRRYERTGIVNLLREAGFSVGLIWNYAYPISILLDVFLHKTYRVDNYKLTREDRSKLSGIKRKKSLFNRLVSDDFFLAPFLVLQRCFLEKDLSSALLVVASKDLSTGKVDEVYRRNSGLQQ